MKISVVIPTRNRSDALAKTLLHLSRQDFKEDWEVVVVNNGSTDDTDEVVQRQSFPVSLRLIHERKPGVAAARNAGVAAAAGQYIVFLDNDILVEPDFIQRHFDALLANPGCWVLGQVINLPEQERTPFGKFRKALYGYTPPDCGVVEARWLTGQIFSLPRADFERLGGFDETFLNASVEDFDFALHAWRLGIKILFHPTIVALHNDWAGFSIRDYCYRQRLYTREEPLFWIKYGDHHPRPELVRENLPPSWQRDGARLFLRKTMKRLLGGKLAQSVIFGGCRALERICPWPPILWRVYRLLLSIAIYQGFQEGLAIHKIDINNRESEPPTAGDGTVPVR